jgi:hypothetical protein
MMIRMLPSGQVWRATAKAHERFADFFARLRAYAKKHGMACAVDVNDTTATIKATHWHGLGLAVAITTEGEVRVKTVYA